MPEVSIIIPVYNMEDYLERCMDSVLAQSFTDYEVLLVDDGSTDSSGSICDGYAAGDGRIHVIHKENGGLSDARNAGLDRACGRYVFFLDSDDRILPEMLEKTVQEIRKGADMVFFRYTTVEPDGSTFLWDPLPGCWDLDTEEERKDFLFRILLGRRLPWQVWNILYDRQRIEEAGLRFEDNRRIFAEDMYFNTCLLFYAKKIRSIPDVLHEYYRRPDSLSWEYQLPGEAPKLFIGKMSENARMAAEHLKNAGAWPDAEREEYRVHELFIWNELKRCGRIFPLGKAEEMRGVMLASVEKDGKPDYFLRQLRNALDHYPEFEYMDSRYTRKANMLLMNYLLDGNAGRYKRAMQRLRIITRAVRAVRN